MIFINYLMFDRFPVIPADEVVLRLNRRLAPFGKTAILTGTGKDNLVTIDVQGLRLVVFLVARPFPDPDLDRAIRSDPTWRTARHDLRNQSHHLIVSAPDAPANYTDAISKAIILTMLSASIVDLSGPVGVIWVPAMKLSKPEAFVSAADSIPSRRVPTLNWINLFVDQSPGNTASLTTAGLAPFVGRELTLPQSGQSFATDAQLVLSVATYLLSEGPVIRDGDTVELAGCPKVSAVYVDTQFAGGPQMIELARDAINEAAQ